MKKEKWLYIAIPVLILITIGFGIINWIIDFFAGGMGIQHGAPFRQGFHGGPIHHHRMGPVHGHSIFGLFSLMGLIVKVGFILIGLVLWQKATGNKKWIGAALAVVGLFALLPWIIALPLAVFIGYLSMRKHSRSPIENLELATTTSEIMAQPNIKDTDFLDQWERTFNREEK